MVDTDGGEQPQSMKAAAMHGGRWNMIEAVALQLAGVATTFVLARLLAKDDFGIIAIVAVAVGLLAILTQVGLGAALIQKKELVPGELSTSFWAALGIGTVIAAGGWALSGPVASLFESPDAAPFLSLAPLSLLFGLTATVPRAVLLRNLQFKTVSIIAIAGSVAYAAAAIGLAAGTDLGVWSVIIAQVARRVVTFSATLVAARWLPRFVFDLAVLRQDLGFAANYFGGTVGMYLVKNVDYWVVRRTTDDATLGTYYLAYVLPTILRQRISWAIDRIMLPVLSRIKEDRPRFRAAYLEIVRILGLVSFPALVGLALVTHVVVPVAFGPGWDEAVAPMTILALAAAVETMWQVASTVLVTDGTPGRTVVVVVFRLAVLGVGLVIAARTGGLLAIAVAVLVGSAVAAAAGQAMVRQRLGLGRSDVVRALLPTAVPLGLMAAALLGLRLVFADLEVAPIIELVTLVVAGAVVYGGAGFTIHRAAFRAVLGDARRLVSRS